MRSSAYSVGGNRHMYTDCSKYANYVPVRQTILRHNTEQSSINYLDNI